MRGSFFIRSAMCMTKFAALPTTPLVCGTGYMGRFELGMRFDPGAALVERQAGLSSTSANSCLAFAFASPSAICTRLCALISPSPEVSTGRKIMSL